MDKATSYRLYFENEVSIRRDNILGFSERVQNERTRSDLLFREYDLITEALINLGRFDEAEEALASATPFKREAFERVISELRTATERDDDETCECQQTRIDGIPVRFIWRHIWSQKHGRVMPVVRCTVCNDLNVTLKR